jgi:hypothetical protein
VVTDANGNPFRADAVVIDGVTVLHTAVQQGLLEFSKKRARVRADNNGLVGDERVIAIEGSSLEIRDFGNIKFKAANLCLSLLGTGIHSAITCREEDEKVTVKGDDNKFNSVSTGKKIPAGFKGIDYNMHTVVRFYRDEDNNVMADVVKDRTGVHPNETLVDPTLLDWQVVIDGNKGKKDFTLRNNLDMAVSTEQEIYSAEVMSNATKSMSKSDMEKAKVSEPKTTLVADTDAESLRAEVNAAMKNMNPVVRKEVQDKLKAANLPADPKSVKVADADSLMKVLSIIEG